MGTVASFSLAAGGLTSTATALKMACSGLHRADAIFSTWKPESPVSRLRRNPALLAEMPEVVLEVIELCEHVTKATAGIFDPWAMPGGFDPSGLVKGWAVEQAAIGLAAAGLAGGIVGVGGDLQTFGSPSALRSRDAERVSSLEIPERWQIGIRHPWRAERLACVLALPGGAVATSGTYERGAHLVHPPSGQPRCRLASATVTGPSAAIADGLATALAIEGPTGLTWLAAFRGYDAYLISSTGEEIATAGIEFVPKTEISDSSGSGSPDSPARRIGAELRRA
jgi:thiamine biosynthesis lipoprotein